MINNSVDALRPTLVYSRTNEEVQRACEEAAAAEGYSVLASSQECVKIESKGFEAEVLITEVGGKTAAVVKRLSPLGSAASGFEYHAVQVMERIEGGMSVRLTQ